jgi:hypothetical protein
MNKPITVGLATGRLLRLIVVVFVSITPLGNLPDVAADDGRVIKQINYDQTVSGVTVLDTNAPYSFDISIQGEFSSAQVSLPPISPYLPNPIVSYVYEVPFASRSSLDTEFPTGTYTFAVSENGTNFTPKVSFSSSTTYPAAIVMLTNPNWSGDGKLILDPNNAVVSWSGPATEMGVPSANGLGAGCSPSCSSFNLSYFLASNATYQATLSAFNKSSRVSVTDTSDSRTFTFSALYGQVLHFSIITTGITESCSYSVENYPADWIFEENGGYGLIEIDASNDCCWSVDTPNSDWIQIQGPSSGCGSGTVAYAVQSISSSGCPPPPPPPRRGTIYVDGHAFAITQISTSPPPICSISISPTFQAINPSGGSFNISVTDTSSCCWVVQNSNSWISVSQSSGMFSTSIFCSVQPNVSGLTLTGTVVIGTQMLTVVQPSVCSNAPATASNLVILQAFYGANGTSNNVLSIIQANVFSNTVNMSVNNSTMGGDPAFGHVKTLSVIYQNDAGLFQLNITEGGTLQIPSCLAQQLSPPPPQFLSANLSGGNFAMSFATVSNQSYTVQANLDLTTTNWFYLTNFTGNGLAAPVSFPISNGVPQEFFRVKQP